MRPATRHLLVMVGVAVALVGGCSETKGPSTAQPADSAQETSAVAEPSSPAPDAGGGVRYLALGDSLTQGVGAPDEQTGAFPALLAERWRADGCEVELQNVGISGYTAGQILAEQVPQIESFAPTIITFQAGGNDIANGIPLDEYRANVKSVLEAATASGARVYVFAMNEWFRSPEGVNYGDDLAARTAAYDDVLIEEAPAQGAEFVDLRDLYKQQADDGQWVEDGLHPTAEAYAAWAEEMAGAIPDPCR